MPNFYTTAPTANTWSGWVTAATTASTAWTWQQWNNQVVTTTNWTAGSAGGNGYTQALREAAQRQILPTPAEIAVAEAAMQRAREQAAEASRKAKEVNDRAEELLLRHLNKDQQAEYKKDSVVHVCVKSGRRYRLQSGSVTVVDKAGKRVESMCCHVPHSYALPTPDQVLAQMLWLTHHEDEFRRTAHFH